MILMLQYSTGLQITHRLFLSTNKDGRANTSWFPAFSEEQLNDVRSPGRKKQNNWTFAPNLVTGTRQNLEKIHVAEKVIILESIWSIAGTHHTIPPALERRGRKSIALKSEKGHLQVQTQSTVHHQNACRVTEGNTTEGSGVLFQSFPWDRLIKSSFPSALGHFNCMQCPALSICLHLLSMIGQAFAVPSPIVLLGDGCMVWSLQLQIRWPTTVLVKKMRWNAEQAHKGGD